VVQRGTFIGLALMLAYTFFVLIRFLRCCLLARFESRKVQLEAPDLQARKRKLVGDLTRGLGILKAIGSAAPFLGLVGTSYGILAEFSGWAMSRGSAVSYLLRATPSALLTAGAGILVAVPAVVIHNMLRTRVEKMHGELVDAVRKNLNERPFCRAQTLPLRPRFSNLPPYALIAAPAFVTIVIVQMLLTPYVATGLHVRLLPMGVLNGNHGLSQPIVVSMIETHHGEYIVRVNSRETSVDDLKQVLASKLGLAAQRRVYIEADGTLAWGSVADVIDKAKGLKSEVILLTTVPAKNAKCAWAGTPTQDSHCAH